MSTYLPRKPVAWVCVKGCQGNVYDPAKDEFWKRLDMTTVPSPTLDANGHEVVTVVCVSCGEVQAITLP